MKRYPRSLAVALLLLGSAMTSYAAELTMGSSFEPDSLDPHFTFGGRQENTLQMIFDRLVLKDTTTALQPGLATEWALIDDTTWEFKLREGVTFHDGSAFNADDVIYSYERALANPPGPTPVTLSVGGIASMEKVDDFTVRIVTKEPAPVLPRQLAIGLMIMPSECGDVATADMNTGNCVIGTGPYKFVSWQAGDRVIYESNPDYWGGLRGSVEPWDRVEWRYISDPAARIAALLSGDVDFIDSVPLNLVPTIESNQDMTVYSALVANTVFMGINSLTPRAGQFRDNTGVPLTENPFADVRVRQAISMAIDRNALIEKALFGRGGQPASQLLPDFVSGTSKTLSVTAYDVEGAKALLAEAGYPEGFQFDLNYVTPSAIDNIDEVAQAVAQLLSSINLTVTIIGQPSAVFSGPSGRQEFAAMLTSGGGDGGHLLLPGIIASKSLGGVFGGMNRGYSNPEFDAMLQTAMTTMDETEREMMFGLATEMGINDVATIPLYVRNLFYAANKSVVGNYTPHAQVLSQPIFMTPAE